MKSGELAWLENRDGSRELCLVTNFPDYQHCKKCDRACRGCDAFTLGDSIRHNCRKHMNCPCHDREAVSSGRVVVEMMVPKQHKYEERSVWPQFLVEYKDAEES